MNRVLTMAIAALVFALGAGCASSPESGASEAQQPSFDRVDRMRMNSINRDANQQGAEIIWVNPPRKGEAKTGG